MCVNGRERPCSVYNLRYNPSPRLNNYYNYYNYYFYYFYLVLLEEVG
jgi:hypothetical protein